MGESTLFQPQNTNQVPSSPPQPAQSVQPVAPPSSFGTPPSAPQQQFRKSNGPLKKIIVGVIALIIVIVLVFLFFPKGASGRVNLVWWGLWEDKAVMQSLITDFERTHPNITIEYSKQDQKQYRERLLTRAANGTGPDIFYFHNTWYPMISDVLLPLPTDVITQDTFKKSFFPVMQEDLIHNGGIYGIPLGADSLSLFVNTELLAAAGVTPPTNWEEFVKAAKILTVKDENGKIVTSGAALGTYNNISHAPDIVSLLFLQQGVTMKNFPSSSQDQVDALDFYVSFANGSQNTWDMTLDQSLLSFSQGKLAMYFGYSWDIFTIQKLNKDLSFKVYPVPSLFNRDMTIASYWAQGVSAKSTHQEAALEFIRYLSQKETAQKLYTEAAKTRAFGAPYARIDLAETVKENDFVYPFVNQLKTAKSSYFVGDTSDGEGGLNSVLNTYLGNAVNAIINDGSSTVSVVETLDQGVAQTFSKYGIQ